MRIPFLLALAWRESRTGKRRALLIVASVAIGVGALVAVNSFTSSLRESVRREARALLGADLALASAGPFTPRAEVLLDELRRATSPPAEVARVVSFASMALVPEAGGTRLVQVLAADPGYPFYGTLETRPAGEWAQLAETGGAIVDDALLVALGARIGSVITLGEARFEIRATIENVPGDVGVRSALGPRVFIPRSRAAETGLLSRGSRARYEAYLRIPRATDAERLAGRFRGAVSAERLSLRTASDDQRRLSETLGRFGSYLGLVALVALLLGGLGVASAVHVFIKRRLTTIAVLRCLGATGGELLAAYVLQAFAVALLGSLVGAALGAALQQVLPHLLRNLLPVDVAWTWSWRAMLAGLATGVWVAVVFSLLPLLAIRRVPALAVLRRDFERDESRGQDLGHGAAVAALAASLVAITVLQAGRLSVGLAFAAGVGVVLLLLWLAAGLLVFALRRFLPRRLPYLYRQGLANLQRPANQTLMIVLTLGFGAFLLSTLLLVQHNLLRDLRIDTGVSRPNLAFFDVQGDQQADVAERVRGEGRLVGPAVPIVPMRIESLAGRPAAELLALEDASQRPERWALRREYRSSYRDAPTASEKIVAGSWWRAGERRGRDGGDPVPIALEANLARELRVGIGSEIGWDVQGLSLRTRVVCLREVEWARFEPNFFVIFPEGPLAEAPRSYVLLARVQDAGRRARLQRSVVLAHPNVSALDLTQVQRALEGVLDKIVVAIRFLALFSLASGAVVLAGAVAGSRYQRVREGALLRALGATRTQLLRILVTEYAVLGTLAAAAAILLSSLAGYLLARFVFAGSFALPGPSLLLLVLAMLGLTVAVGLSGSGEVWRRPPAEVLRAE